MLATAYAASGCAGAVAPNGETLATGRGSTHDCGGTALPRAWGAAATGAGTAARSRRCESGVPGQDVATRAAEPDAAIALRARAAVGVATAWRGRRCDSGAPAAGRCERGGGAGRCDSATGAGGSGRCDAGRGGRATAEYRALAASRRPWSHPRAGRCARRLGDLILTTDASSAPLPRPCDDVSGTTHPSPVARPARRPRSLPKKESSSWSRVRTFTSSGDRRRAKLFVGIGAP